MAAFGTSPVSPTISTVLGVNPGAVVFLCLLMLWVIEGEPANVRKGALKKDGGSGKPMGRDANRLFLIGVVGGDSRQWPLIEPIRGYLSPIGRYTRLGSVGLLPTSTMSLRATSADAASPLLDQSEFLEDTSKHTVAQPGDATQDIVDCQAKREQARAFDFHTVVEYGHPNRCADLAVVRVRYRIDDGFTNSRQRNAPLLISAHAFDTEGTQRMLAHKLCSILDATGRIISKLSRVIDTGPGRPAETADLPGSKRLRGRRPSVKVSERSTLCCPTGWSLDHAADRRSPGEEVVIPAAGRYRRRTSSAMRRRGTI